MSAIRVLRSIIVTSYTISAKASQADDQGSKDDKKAADSKSEEISVGCIVEVR